MFESPGLSGASRSPPGPQSLERSSALPAWVVVIGCTALVCLIAVVDFVTPTNIALSFYYAVPVLIATWFAGRWTGLALTCLTLALWTLNELLDFSGRGVFLVIAINLMTRAIALSAAVVLLSSFKTLSRQLSMLVEERTAALRKMATRLAEAEDTERRRLATDLHDGLSQKLSLLKLNLSAALGERRDDPASRERLPEAIRVVNELIDTSRTLTFDLHPAMLDHLGLVPTLRQLAEDFGRQAALDITINEEGAQRPLQMPVARHLFRSLKELLSNAARHGQAKQIVLSVYWKADSLRLVVDDDGLGFDSTRVLTPDSSRGLGLPSINERVRSLGGTMGMESNTDAGTRVVLEVPLASV